MGSLGKLGDLEIQKLVLFSYTFIASANSPIPQAQAGKIAGKKSTSREEHTRSKCETTTASSYGSKSIA